jgi:polysaccharide pyruvyl transferase WcaK-like protein
MPGVHEDPLRQAYVRTLTDLFVRHKASFVLIPHDLRGTMTDAALARSILDALPSAVKSHCFLVPAPCTAAEIRGICGLLDVAVSGRMHCAIACLGEGTPVVCITYQDKFEGLFQHFELRGMTIDPQEALQPERLPELLAGLVQARESIRGRIESRLPHIEKLALANLG